MQKFYLLLVLKNFFKYIIIYLSWGCNGFDIAFEAWIASSGFSLATIKTRNLNINADNRELAFAA